MFRKLIMKGVLASALGIGTIYSSGIAQATDSITPWVNDSTEARGGYYLDPFTCKVWTPERDWHQRSPSGPPLWVNYPYGPAGGFYWDPVSCMVWTSDANWHAFNKAGIWPPSSPVTQPPSNPTPAPAKNGRPKWLGSQCELAPNIPVVSDKVKTSYTAPDALAYPSMVAVDPNRSSTDFPDDVVNGVKPLVGYDVSFQNGDYFEDCFGDTDVPQYYWRVESTGYFWIPRSEDTPEDIVCMASENKGCLLIIINHFGPTMKLNGVYDDNGFTVAGPVWDMSTPEKVTAAAQVLTDHYVNRMIYGVDKNGRNDGTNCGVIEGCNSIEWHVVYYGGNRLQKHMEGIYKP